MSQRPPSLVSDTHYCVVGDVTIEATAAIAPGVVLQASTGSRIVVGKGVCLAAGVCIQSRNGILTIQAGASLGANVLIVGSGTVGANACISAGSTIINPAVEAEAILPPDTLMDASINTGAKPSQSGSFEPSSGFKANSFTAPIGSANSFTNGLDQPAPSTSQADPFPASTFVEPEPIMPKSIQIPDIPQQPNKFVSPPSLNQPFNQANGSYSNPLSNQTNNVQSDYGKVENGSSAGGSGSFQNSGARSPIGGSSSLTVHSSSDRVYGRDQVSQLITTLFPHRQPLDNHSQS